jgi:hypothetical protein
LSDIFISYAREDRERVAPIAKILEALGWSLWWDPNILSGAEFDEVIVRELKAARCVLVLWSHKSVDSRWVRGEARDGLNRGIVVPVMLDAVPPPLDFRTIHSIDFSTWRGDADCPAITQLRDSIVGVIDQPPNPAGPTELKRDQVWRRRVRVLQLAAAALGSALLLLLALNYRGVARGFEMAGGAVHAVSSTRALGSGLTSDLSSHRAVLTSSLGNLRVAYMGRKISDPWAAAQLMATPGGDTAVERRVFDGILPAGFDSQCQCWAPVDGGQHAVATAWIILAHVARHRLVAPNVIEHLLNAQWPDGSWPLYFDAEQNPAHESTYATVYLALALSEYRRFGEVTGEYGARIDTAIEQAGGWLFAHRPPRGGRWIDYPNSTVRPLQSRGLSALTTFTFLRIFHDQRADMVLRDWLAGVRHTVDFDFLESTDQYIERAGGGAHHDGTRYVVFAWELAALLVGYPHLEWRERIRAQWLLSEALSRWSHDPKTMQLEWLLAESAYAFALTDPAKGPGLASAVRRQDSSP